MKKYIAMLLVLTMAAAMLAGCGATGNTEKPTQAPTEAPTDAPAETPKASYEGTMEELVNAIITQQPVEFMGGNIPVDLTDTSEDGLWAVKTYTGLDNADQIQDIGVFEPMMGSIAFSMVAVRANEGVDTKALAETMKTNIDQRKWICVEADDLMVAGCGDVVMLIMVSSESGMTAQSFVDAFQSVCGELDFAI
jgi:predicted small lipoprotein YifL